MPVPAPAPALQEQPAVGVVGMAREELLHLLHRREQVAEHERRQRQVVAGVGVVGARGAGCARAVARWACSFA